MTTIRWKLFLIIRERSPRATVVRCIVLIRRPHRRVRSAFARVPTTAARAAADGMTEEKKRSRSRSVSCPVTSTVKYILSVGYKYIILIMLYACERRHCSTGRRQTKRVFWNLCRRGRRLSYWSPPPSTATVLYRVHALRGVWPPDGARARPRDPFGLRVCCCRVSVRR